MYQVGTIDSKNIFVTMVIHLSKNQIVGKILIFSYLKTNVKFYTMIEILHKIYYCCS